MEIYQWLFRQKGFKVSDTGYFVYVNGRKDREAFDGKLEFDVTLIAHKGDDSWVHGKILEIKKLLDQNEIPEPAETCEYCAYRKFSAQEASKFMKAKKENETKKRLF